MSSSQMKDQLSRELESIMLAKLRESPFFALYSPFAGLAAAATSTPFSHLVHNGTHSKNNNQNRHHNHHNFLTIPRHDSGFQGKSRFKRYIPFCLYRHPFCLSLSLSLNSLSHSHKIILSMVTCWMNTPVINHLILHTHLPVAHTCKQIFSLSHHSWQPMCD